jgi:hypothetical protein
MQKKTNRKKEKKRKKKSDNAYVQISHFSANKARAFFVLTNLSGSWSSPLTALILRGSTSTGYSEQ